MCMGKEGWCVQLGQGKDFPRNGGRTVWNNLKVGGLEKREKEVKFFKKLNRLGLGVVTLKGLQNPITNYMLVFEINLFPLSTFKTSAALMKINETICTASQLVGFYVSGKLVLTGIRSLRNILHGFWSPDWFLFVEI